MGSDPRQAHAGCTIIYSPVTALLANLSDDGVGGDATLVVFVT
jgi:hypothetical protein